MKMVHCHLQLVETNDGKKKNEAQKSKSASKKTMTKNKEKQAEETKKSSKKRKPKKEKRPPNGYILYTMSKRKELLEVDPKLTMIEVTKLAAVAWNKLSGDQKEVLLYKNLGME